MNVFDIIGPVMIGPSSSHTAGMARIGMMANRILQVEAASVRLKLVVFSLQICMKINGFQKPFQNRWGELRKAK